MLVRCFMEALSFRIIHFTMRANGNLGQEYLDTETDCPSLSSISEHKNPDEYTET